MVPKLYFWSHWSKWTQAIFHTNSMCWDSYFLNNLCHPGEAEQATWQEDDLQGQGLPLPEADGGGGGEARELPLAPATHVCSEALLDNAAHTQTHLLSPCFHLWNSKKCNGETEG